MGKKGLFIAFFGLVCCLSTTLCAYTVYPEITEQQRERFYQAMDKEINTSQQLLKNTYEEVKSGQQFINPAAKVEHDALVGSLETKQILAARFRNAPSIRSPKVRDKLLSIFKKKIITPEDLYELDDLVVQEKKLMGI